MQGSIWIEGHPKEQDSFRRVRLLAYQASPSAVCQLA